MEKLLLGIDIGTSACKAAVFRLDGTVVAQASVGLAVHHPAPGWAEQHPQDWWQGACAAIGKALNTGGIDNRQIGAVGVDGQSWAAVPVDQSGRALHATPIWMDTRSADIAEELIRRVGHDEIFAVSGNPMEPTYSTAKMLWFKRNLPDIYKNTHQFLQSNSYLVLQLTGRFTMDLSQGFGVHGFDMAALRWHDGMCDALGLDREKLPDLFPSHRIVGEVTREAAEATGLHPGTPVAAGMMDSTAATLGAGVHLCGQVQEQGGTAGGMEICVDRPVTHRQLILSPHAVPGLWLLMGASAGGGGCYDWFRKELGAASEALARQAGRSAFTVMDEEASAIPAGSGGVVFLPYMAGERSPIWDRHAKGVFFGLGYDKTRAHMARAVMEGCAFSLEHNLRTAMETGVSIGAMHSIGGAANSPLWTQIKTDVTNRVIHVPRSDTASTLGAAMAAGVGAGLYRSFAHAVASTVQILRTHEPDSARHAVYQKKYMIYRELYENTKDLMAKINDI